MLGLTYKGITYMIDPSRCLLREPERVFDLLKPLINDGSVHTRYNAHAIYQDGLVREVGLKHDPIGHNIFSVEIDTRNQLVSICYHELTEELDNDKIRERLKLMDSVAWIH